MTKPRLLALSFALLVLTACAPAEPAIPSPSPVESLPPPQNEHLEFYDEFDRYNNGVDEHDFRVAEVAIDGKLHYCFYNREYEYPILVFAAPRDDTAVYQATLELHYSQHKPLEFEMPVFLLGGGNVDGIAEFYLEDLTGDGTPELVYIYGAGGTGVWEENVKVFDLSTMTECPVAWDNDSLSELVQLVPVELRDTDKESPTIVYAVTGPDGQTAYCSAVTKKHSLPDSAEARFGGHESLYVQDGVLSLTTYFSSDAVISGTYLGGMIFSLSYAPDTGLFTLHELLDMPIFEPVYIPANS